MEEYVAQLRKIDMENIEKVKLLKKKYDIKFFEYRHTDKKYTFRKSYDDSDVGFHLRRREQEYPFSTTVSHIGGKSNDVYTDIMKILTVNTSTRFFHDNLWFRESDNIGSFDKYEGCRYFFNSTSTTNIENTEFMEYVKDILTIIRKHTGDLTVDVALKEDNKYELLWIVFIVKN